MKLCDKITKLRKRKGYTQEELASIMEVSRQSVFKWESGENTPDLEKIKKLTKVFNVSFDELLDDTKELGEVSEVSPRQDKKLTLLITAATVTAIALGTICYLIGRATNKPAPITSSTPESSIPTSIFESQSSIEQTSSEPTSEELTSSLIINDLLGRWQTARYIWNIEDVNSKIMLTTIYDKVDTTTIAHELKDEYAESSYFVKYNDTTGLMEGALYHYTGATGGEWYPITIKRDKHGIHIYWKNLTFEKF